MKKKKHKLYPLKTKLDYDMEEYRTSEWHYDYYDGDFYYTDYKDYHCGDYEYEYDTNKGYSKINMDSIYPKEVKRQKRIDKILGEENDDSPITLGDILKNNKENEN